MYLLQYFENNPALFLLFLAWSLVWKGMAMWKSARDSQKWWFIAILLLNTLGLLEIFYIYALPRLKEWQNKRKEKQEAE